MAIVDDLAPSLEISRRFDAPPERVFDAWASREWGKWLPPAGAHCEVLELEPRVGGRYHVRMSMADGRTVNLTGRYREFVRPKKLVLTWLTDYNNQETVINVTFERDRSGTVMTLRQSSFPDTDLRDRYKCGWTGPGGAFDKLAALMKEYTVEGKMANPVKLYNHPVAPNPRRVRIFAAEKGIQLELEDVDVLAGQSRTPEFLAKNSSGGVPVLELDDGTCLSESVAICRYLEGIRPEPNMFGRDLREQVEIERWNRRMELELFSAIGRTVQNTSPIFQGRFKQFPDYGEAQREIAYKRLERMDRELNGQPFVAGERFTIADITALCAIDVGRALANLEIAPAMRNLTRWHAAVSSRPSAKA